MNKKKVYMILMIIFWAVTFISWIIFRIITKGFSVVVPRLSIIHTTSFTLAIISTLQYMKNRSKEVSRTQKVILNVILWTVIGIVPVFFIAYLGWVLVMFLMMTR